MGTGSYPGPHSGPAAGSAPEPVGAAGGFAGLGGGCTGAGDAYQDGGGGLVPRAARTRVPSVVAATAEAPDPPAVAPVVVASVGGIGVLGVSADALLMASHLAGRQ
nr:hypothetical protein [Streptomyces sp. RPA4-2]